jgi:uncharacterized protein YoxC
MKYWTNLSEIENIMYELDKIRISLSILTNTDEMTDRISELGEDHKTFIMDLEDRMSTKMKEFKVSFQQLWDRVREDSSSESEKDEDRSNRWDHIVNDLQKWNEDSMINMGASAISPNADDMITISPSEPYGDLDFTKNFDDEWLHIQRMNQFKS